MGYVTHCITKIHRSRHGAKIKSVDWLYPVHLILQFWLDANCMKFFSNSEVF